MKKLVSFSLYGDLNCYFQGAIENLKIKNDFYHDWTYRFYVENTISEGYINKILSFPNTQVIKKTNSNHHMNMFWRFEPLDENEFDLFIVRDLDSRPTKREIDAVNEWIDSEFSFHIIRDNKVHTSNIMGGTWGAKSKFKPNFSEILKKWITKNPNIVEQHKNHKRGQYFGLDQRFMSDAIWKLIKEDHMCHIEDYENLKKTGNEKILPPSDGDFIGRSYLKNLNNKYKF